MHLWPSKPNERKLCVHYGYMSIFCTDLMIFESHLTLLGEECTCKKCGKAFPAEKYEQMERLIDYLTGVSKRREHYSEDHIKKLSQGVEPVYYRRTSKNEIEILETVEDQVIVPKYEPFLPLPLYLMTLEDGEE